MYRLIFKLAYNNAFLRLSRTMLVIIMIGVSMSLMLSIQGLYDGMTITMIDKSKRSDSGEISIYASGYRVSQNIKDIIPNAKDIKEQIEAIKGVKSVVSRIHAQGLSATARKSAFSTIIGIDLEAEKRFGDFEEFLKEGEIRLDDRGVIVALELAKKLKIKIGSKIIFSTQDSSNEINAMALRVRAIVQTSNIALDTTAIFVDKSKLEKFLLLGKGSATQIAIRTDRERLLEELNSRYKALDVKSFLQLNPMLKQMQEMMVIFNSITFFIVMLVVFIGIMGVSYVSILGRIREFGIMKSIGLSYPLIRLQIILEALFISLVGYLLGAILGYVSLYYLVNTGLDLSQFADGMEQFGMSSTIYGVIKVSYFTSTFLAIVGASILSVILPLRKIKNMSVIDVTKVDK